MTEKVMTGQEFIDLADPQEKMCRLNPHSRFVFMFPGFDLVAPLAVAVLVVFSEFHHCFLLLVNLKI